MIKILIFYIQAVIIILRSSGRGVIPHRRYSPQAERYDPVRLRSRQYSLDERRWRMKYTPEESGVFLFDSFRPVYIEGGSVMKKRTLSTLIKISVLSAMAFILMYVDFPLPIFPTFLKIDFSDVPALLGAFAMGPVAGIIIELIKNLLIILLKGTQTGFVGELANFIVGAVLVGVAGILYKRTKTRANALVSIIAGIIFMSAVASIANYFVLLPLYGMTGAAERYSIILSGILPFNLFKGVLAGAITFLAYKKISPILHK